MSILERLISDLDEKGALDEIRKQIIDGKKPENILEETQRGLQIVGKKFESKQYALIELEMADELFRKCVNLIETFSREKYFSQPGKLIRKKLLRSDAIDLG